MYHPALQRQLIEAHQQGLRRLMTGQRTHARRVSRSTRRDRRRGVIRLRLIAPRSELTIGLSPDDPRRLHNNTAANNSVHTQQEVR